MYIHIKPSYQLISHQKHVNTPQKPWWHMVDVGIYTWDFPLQIPNRIAIDSMFGQIFVNPLP